MSLHLITGAGAGIGAATAERLHGRGDALLLLARSQERAAELEDRFPGARTVVADLARPEVLDLTLPDRLDSVIHSAGVVELGSVADLGASAWAQQLNVNLIAPALLTRLALPALRAGRGTVVFVNSGSGRVTHPGWSAYGASKHGLVGLADALRGEEAANGVRVSTVYPGRVATPMQEQVHEHEDKTYDPADWIQPGTVADAILHMVDLPADATVPEIVIKPVPLSAP